MRTIQWKEKTLHFIPTAHVSKVSVDEVREAIETLHPEAVLIELDSGRAQSLQSTASYDDIDIKEMIKQKQFVKFSTQLLLANFQKRIAEEEDTRVGGEMIQAIESAKNENIPLYYIDRDVNITMKRLWNSMSTYKKTSLAVSMIFSSFEDDEVDVEALKDDDLLFHMISEMETEVPDLAHVILHERNAYMAEKIKRNPFNELVIVIGAAHLEGIIEALDQEHDIKRLNTVPIKKKKSWKSWIVPLLVITLFASLFIKNPQAGFKELIYWFLLSGGLASFGALILRAHPLSIIASFIGAPLGVLSPVISVGFFSTFAEAYKRPPKVSDFERLSEDSKTFKGWYHNLFLRLILIMFVTSLLSSVGTFIAGGKIIKQLF